MRGRVHGNVAAPAEQHPVLQAEEVGVAYLENKRSINQYQNYQSYAATLAHGGFCGEEREQRRRWGTGRSKEGGRVFFAKK